MTRKKRTAEPEFDALVARVAARALDRLGWSDDEDDDARLIRAATPTIVDETLTEVVEAFNAELARRGLPT